MGGFKLIAPNACNIEIRSKKSRALLAILATSPDGERTRSWLQSHLWSRGSSQASLRKELSNIRSALDGHAIEIFKDDAPKDIVRLNLDSFATDVTDNSKPWVGVFLDGLDLAVEEPFEDWLRKQRSIFCSPSAKNSIPEAKTAPILAVQTILSDSKSAIPKRFCIGLNPVVWPELKKIPTYEHTVLDDLLTRVGKILLSSGMIELYDRRHSTHSQHMLSTQKASSCNAEFIITAYAHRSGLIITLSLIERGTNRVILSRREKIHRQKNDKEATYFDNMKWLVAELADELLYRISRDELISDEQRKLMKLVYGSIDNMFDLTYEGLISAEENLEQALEINDESAIYAWRSFLSTLVIDSHSTIDHNEVREKAIYYSEKALEKDRYNPLSLSLLTHVHAFTLQDIGRATDLMNQVSMIGSDHVMTYDAGSLLYLYLGKLDQSRNSALQAAQLGRFLSFRYLFMTTLCMIDGLEGKYSSAVHAGERALTLQPTSAERPYPPTIRYLSQSYAKMGQHEKSLQLIEVLKRADSEMKLGSQNDDDKVSPTELVKQFLDIGSNYIN